MNKILLMLLLLSLAFSIAGCSLDKNDESENDSSALSSENSHESSLESRSNIQSTESSISEKSDMPPSSEPRSNPQPIESSIPTKNAPPYNPPVEENSKSLPAPKNNNDEPRTPDHDDGRLAVDTEREVLDENDYRPDPDASGADDRNAEAIELFG